LWRYPEAASQSAPKGFWPDQAMKDGNSSNRLLLAQSVRLGLRKESLYTFVVQITALPSRSFLEQGAVPYSQLAQLALKEGRRPRPIYQIHKWFARRLGCVFRALLVGAVTSPTADFWRAYYEEAELRDITVLDPFVGGGTSVIEALRLGATAIGVDVDPVACAITRLETAAADLPDLTGALELLKERVARKIAPFHETQDTHGRRLIILHHFWVQIVSCPCCGYVNEAHPNYVLAWNAEQQWAFCSACGNVSMLPATNENFWCHCGKETKLWTGVVANGAFTCRECRHREPLIENGRRSQAPPIWKLFAVEAFPAAESRTPVPMAKREFLAADHRVLELYNEAARQLQEQTRKQQAHLPSSKIKKTYNDRRLIDYGYFRWTDLFNSRQLLHLALLAEAIHELDQTIRTPIAIAFSNHLATNCMMTAYAGGWRRLTPLFSIRGYRHVPRPVELNPWLEGTGRGTFPNAVRQLLRARSFMRKPTEPAIGGGFQATPAIRPQQEPKIICGTARKLTGIRNQSVDLVLTDPPYFDNIAYPELADFYAPWWEMLGLVKRAERRLVRTDSICGDRNQPTSLHIFARKLGQAFVQIARVLRPHGMLVFTFRHTLPEAWYALALALARTVLKPVQVLPVPGEVGIGLHAHAGTVIWDAVLVFRKDPASTGNTRSITVAEATVAKRHANNWRKRLRTAPLLFSEADLVNLLRAHLVAASRGMFGSYRRGPSVTLLEALQLTS
jgi:putative DNA methylase